MPPSLSPTPPAHILQNETKKTPHLVAVPFYLNLRENLWKTPSNFWCLYTVQHFGQRRLRSDPRNYLIQNFIRRHICSWADASWSHEGRQRRNAKVFLSKHYEYV